MNQSRPASLGRTLVYYGYFAQERSSRIDGIRREALRAHYQERQSSTAPGMRWNGAMIEARRGAKVRAPYFGRVVYADWLQGLGLLLIIGHGGGYMTLYGHAEVLYKSVGDWVAPGDVIAALSEANGTAPQLYFEIRAGRKTVDPKAWLKTSP